MKAWQIGVDSIDGADVRWLEDFVDAETQMEAEREAMIKGYYRNIRLRIVAEE